MAEFKRNHIFSNKEFKKFYDKQAKDLPRASNLFRRDRLLPTYWGIKEILNYKKPPCNILDVGCQHGKNGLILTLLFYNVTAIDVTEIYLNKSKENTKTVGNKIEYRVLPVEEVSILNKNFDIVLCLSVMEHVADFKKAFNSILSVINYNGLMLFTVPIKNSWMATEHVRTFDRNNLKLYFPKESEIIELKYSDNTRQLGWYGIKCIKK